MLQQDPRTTAIADVIASRWSSPAKRVLVVGCGTGIEAATLALRWGAEVVGVDLAPRFREDASRYARLERGDATALAFPDGDFDLVYSYHVLEHIPDHRKALSEMSRVLRDDGDFCVGTPNRQRLLGYLGGGSSAGDKLRWNLADWSARLRGRFRNEYGAHAGFTAEELRADLASAFGNADGVAAEYYERVYPRHRAAISALERSGAARYLYPSIYFVGRKAGAAAHASRSSSSPSRPGTLSSEATR